MKKKRPQLIGHEKRTKDMMVWAQVEKRVKSLKNHFAHYIVLIKTVLVFTNLLFVNEKGKSMYVNSP